jgi:hypothetical protein
MTNIKSITPLKSVAARMVALGAGIPQWFYSKPRGHQPDHFDEMVLRELRIAKGGNVQADADVWSRGWSKRWPPYLLYNHDFMTLSPWVMIETCRTRQFSIFMLFLQGCYICDTLQPSLHQGTRQWPIGGRGGLPSGLYRLWPYSWKDKRGLPVWELVGDKRRGAILLHSGNNVNDSKGCILCGIHNGKGKLSASRVGTSVVWSLLNQGPEYGVIATHPGFSILRVDSAYGS